MKKKKIIKYLILGGVILIGIGGYVIYNSVSGLNELRNNSNKIQTVQESNNSSNKEVDKDKSNKDVTVDTEVGNTQISQPPKELNLSGTEAIFHESFPRATMVKIVDNNDTNLLKIYATFISTWLENMSKQQQAALEGKISISKYVSSVDTTRVFMKDTISSLKELSKETKEANVKEKCNNFIQDLSTIVTQIDSEMKVYNANTVGVQMFKTLPFGKNLNSTLEKINTFNDSLGGNKDEISNWKKYSKKIFESYNQ